MRPCPTLLALFATLALGAVPLPDFPLWDCEDTQDNGALELSRDLKRTGEASVRWRNHTEHSGFRIDDLPGDWSGYHVLRFWLHNATANNGRCMLLIHSQNEATEGMDYWGFRIHLNFTGWREFSFPIGGSHGQARSPRGWDQIDGISFTASGWGCIPLPDSDLHFDDFRLVHAPPRPGPLMSDEEFFAELDLDRPELAAVSRAVAEGDLPAAKAALLDHFRQRREPTWHFDWRDRPTDLPPLRPGSGGWDYFNTGFTVDWTGWREFVFPLAEWNVSREPQGWHFVNGFRLSSTWGDRTPHPDTHLVFDGIRLVGDEALELADFGTDEGLVRWPDFVPVRPADLGGGIGGAWRVAAAPDAAANGLPRDWRPYRELRFRVHSAKATGDRITLLADSDVRHLTRANRLLDHVYQGHFLGERIDWESNNREPGDPAFTREWTYSLNRFRHWRVLGDAYWETGDETYARGWIDQMRAWIEDNPFPYFDNGNRSLTWRTIEAGIRTSTTWPDSLMYFLGSPSLEPDDLVMFLKSWIEHARHLMRITLDYPDHGGNWVTMECNGLGHLGILLPECRHAPLWLQTAADRLGQELERQVYPDGAQKELTTHYHQVALKNFVALYQFAVRNGHALDERYLASLERMYQYNLKVMDPEGFLPPLNDSNRTDVRQSLLEGHDLFGREDFLWGATLGGRGRVPDFISVALPWAGQYIMRSGWEPDALYCLFEAGPYGTGHQHEDKLSLVLHGLGRELLTEAGNYRYDASVYRRYALSTWAHNTILVDGQGQRRRGLGETYETDRPLDNLWLHNELFDAAAGLYDHGYGPRREIQVRHERTVVFLRDDYWVVLDRVEGEGERLLDILWHLKATAAEQREGGLAAHGTDPGVANLLVTPAPVAGLELEIVTGRHDPPLGFAPVGNRTPIPVLDYRLRSELPATLAWVLTPYRGGVPDVAIDTRETETGTLLTVNHPGGRDEIAIARAGTAGPRIEVHREDRAGTRRHHAE